LLVVFTLLKLFIYKKGVLVMLLPDGMIEKIMTKCNAAECAKATVRDIPNEFVVRHQKIIAEAHEIAALRRTIDARIERLTAQQTIIWSDMKELYPELDVSSSRMYISNDSKKIYSTPCESCLSDNPEKLAELLFGFKDKDKEF
jgi:hypothetical protein